VSYVVAVVAETARAARECATSYTPSVVLCW